MNVVIRPERPDDWRAIRHVNQAAFDGDTEADLVESLRDGGFVEVSLVADMHEEIVGHILFSRVSIVTDGGTMNVLSLAPMAVLPGHQRKGIGSKLLEHGLELCRAHGHRIVVVLGHPEFYSRFGFSSELAASLESPFGGGKAWMVLELEPNSMMGIEGQVEYSPPFRSLE